MISLLIALSIRPEYERNTIALPVTVESVASAARDVAIASLQQLLGDRLSTVAPVREQHGKDASYHPCAPPDAVAFTQSTAEVSEIVKICARHKVPIIPFGSGTGLEGPGRRRRHELNHSVFETRFASRADPLDGVPRHGERRGGPG